MCRIKPPTIEKQTSDNQSVDPSIRHLNVLRFGLCPTHELLKLRTNHRTMPRPRVHGLESYKDIPLDHPLRRKIQNRNAQRTFRKKRAASNGQEVEQATNEQAESAGGGATVDTGSASAESGVSAENKSNSINVEPWVIPVVSSPQDLNIDSLDLEPHEAVGSGAVDQMDNTNGMSQPDSVSFSRPTSHPQLDAGFLDPVDLYASHTITNQEGFPPPFSVNGTETQFDFEPEWQPVQSQIQLQVPGTSRKQSRRRPSQTLSSNQSMWQLDLRQVPPLDPFLASLLPVAMQL
ncbi:hypothetical protein V8F06_008944 [Rhypophila decipiens]